MASSVFYFNSSGKRVLHRESGPALNSPSGREEWYANGQRHREGGPAVFSPDGGEEWWFFGALHRESGPAFVASQGREGEWETISEKKANKIYQESSLLNGLDDYFLIALDPEDSVYQDYSSHTPVAKEWRVNGELHREGGPARKYSGGTEEWYKNNQLQKRIVCKEDIEKLYNDWALAAQETKLDSVYNLETYAEIQYKIESGQIDAETHLRTDLPQFALEAHLEEGLLHREDGPALIFSDYKLSKGKVIFGEKRVYYRHGKREREEGSDGTFAYYKDVRLHREAGPALLDSKGREVVQGGRAAQGRWPRCYWQLWRRKMV